MNSKIWTLVTLVLFAMTACGEIEEAPRQPSAQANVEVLTKSFVIPGLDRERKLRVYVPSDYKATEKHYPVLYMHDGQNLFDDVTSFVGEWKIDESLNKLAKENALELIVVGIDNGGDKRMNELSPWENSDFGKAEGEQYLAFITDVIKPFVDANYRTKPQAEFTAIMGSSMGGLISHYAIHQRPDVFSKAGIFSPSYWFSEQVFAFTSEKPVPDTARLYFLVGTEEGENMVSNMEKMVAQQLAQNHPERHLRSKVVKGAEHNEGFWSEEFSEAILWLFSNK